MSRCLADEDASTPVDDAAPAYYTLYSSGGAGHAATESESPSSPASTSSHSPPPRRPLSLSELRAEFPALRAPESASEETGCDATWCLMENAGGSQVPASVADAVRDHMLRSYAQLGAGYPHSNRATVSASLPLVSVLSIRRFLFVYGHALMTFHVYFSPSIPTDLYFF